MITVLLSLAFSAEAQVVGKTGFAEIKTFNLDVQSKSRYRADYGPNRGELILEVKYPPAELLPQINQYIGENLIAVKVLNETETLLKVKLVISPSNFAFRHRRTLEPHRIVITIGYDLRDGSSIKSKQAIYPLVPFWEAIIDNTPVLPDFNFKNIPANIPQITAKDYLNAVDLKDMGAYSNAIGKIRTNLLESSGPLWVENLVLLADIQFNAALENEKWDDALRAVLSAEQENLNTDQRIRMLLERAYVSNNRGMYEEAYNYFNAGATEWRRLRTWFELGLLENHLLQKKWNKAEDLAKNMLKRRGLTAAAERKICFARVTVMAVNGKIRDAAHLVDDCINTIENDRPSAAQYLMAGEIKYLAEELGDAREYYGKVTSLYSSFWQSALALLRQGDLAAYQGRNEESVQAYRRVIMDWPESPMAKLAELRISEYISRQSEEENPMLAYEQIDLVGAPEILERDAKLRLMWHYHYNGNYIKAFAYLNELYNRFNLERYWVFQPDRFSAVVMDTYRTAFSKEEYDYIIKQQVDGIRFPLSKTDQEMLSFWAAESLRYGLRARDAIKVYLKELERQGHSPEGERRLLMGLTNAYLSTGDHFRARMTQDFFFARYHSTTDQLDHLLAMAEIERQAGNLKASIASYEQALTLCSDERQKLEIGSNLGQIYYRLERYEDVVKLLSDNLAVYLSPSIETEAEIIPEFVSHGLFYLADSFFKTGKYNEAQLAYRRALLLFPDDSRVPVALYYDAEISAMQGDIKSAVKRFEELAASKDESWSRIGKLKAETIGWKPDMQNVGGDK